MNWLMSAANNDAKLSKASAVYQEEHRTSTQMLGAIGSNLFIQIH